MDNIAVEVEPAENPESQLYPVHVRLIRDLGLTIGEVWWLEDVATECIAEDRWGVLPVRSSDERVGWSGFAHQPHRRVLSGACSS